MCTGKNVEVAPVVAIVSTRVSPQTINQKSAVLYLISLLEMGDIAKIASNHPSHGIFA